MKERFRRLLDKMWWEAQCSECNAFYLADAQYVGACCAVGTAGYLIEHVDKVADDGDRIVRKHKLTRIRG